MFGYVTIYRKDLTESALDCYQGYYCGLCEALGRRYGSPGRMTLSYDMTFASILQSALYDPDTVHSTGRCLPHPIKARPRAANAYVDYAADMSIALAYYNYLDDWQDETMENGLTSWSDKAQVYLYCAVEETGLRLTMTNLSGMDKGKS